MINLTPIPKEIQKRMREKMNAVARDTPYYPNASTDELTQEKMLTRTTFMKMVSGQNNPVILMGGELVSGGRVTDSDGNPILSSGRLGDHIAEGYDEVYGPRTFTADYAFDTLGENTAKRPMPGVKSLTATFQGGIKARREATISWVCWSFDDLNRLMPHFLAHGKTVMIQWGWIYDKNSLRSYDTFMSGKKIKQDAYNSNHLIKVIDQKGDYDMMTGVIKNFSFTARQDGGFDCETIITSVGVNILSNTEGTISSIDPITTYEISKGDKKNRFKIREALDSASEEGTDNKLVRLNSTMSLKIFLSNINSYIFQETKKNGTTIEFLERNPLSQKSPKGEESGPLIDKALIKYVPNKYIQATALDGEGRNNNYFVRWGWFEDNILSKFLSVTNEKGEQISEFRSVERVLDASSIKPKLDENGKPTFISTKIKSHPQMQTLSINEYILPGKFYPQSEAFSAEVDGKTVLFPGDSDYIKQLAKLTNDETKFNRFDIYTNQPPKEGPQGQKIKKNSKGQFFYYIDENDKSKGVKVVEVEESPANYGYLRNMLINTKVIKRAFGIGGGVGVESINIFESIDSMFEILNSKIAYWNFQLVSDEVDSYRLKIIDGSTTWIDFQRPPSSYRTRFLGNEVVGKPGVFHFPVWKHNSIVKNQDLQAKIPNSMQLAAMYGSNVDSVKAFSKSSFQEIVGAAAGGLFNDEDDQKNKGLDLAYLNKQSENIGTQSGFADEELSNKGDNIKDFILTTPISLDSNISKDLNELSEKLVAAGQGNELFFDPSKPPPFFDQLSQKEKNELLTYKGQKADDETIVLSENYKHLFSSKFDLNGDLRNEYVGTISAMITFWDEDNSNDTRPLEMLFDLSLEIDGIGGIQPGNSFQSAYLPQKYLEACVFQATNVEHTVDSSTWTSNITGIMRSTVGYVFDTRTTDERTDELLENLKGEVLKSKKKEKKPEEVTGRKVATISDYYKRRNKKQ